MKILLPATLLACLAFTGYAQESEKYQKAKKKSHEVAWDEEKSEKYNDWVAKPGYHEGYVLNADSNKIEGIVIDQAVSSVKIILPSGETRRYQASKCKGYGFNLYRFISMGNRFAQVIYDMKSIGIYKRPIISFRGNGSMPMGMTPIGSIPVRTVPTTMNRKKGDRFLYYIRKKNEKNFEQVKGVNFANKFSKYFADCPYLHENIKKKTLGSSENDLTAIAAIYDRECAPANK
jgi:hypothetical protein